MGAVSCAEGIVYINLCKRSKLLCKFGIVLFLARIKADILEENTFACLHGSYFSLRIVADDVAAHTNGLPKQFRKPYRYRRKAEFGQPFAFRAPEMRAKNNPCPVLNKIFYGGQRRHNAFVICDDAVLQRNVEIAAHQNALALYVNIPYGHFVCSVHKSLPFCK